MRATTLILPIAIACGPKIPPPPPERPVDPNEPTLADGHGVPTMAEMGMAPDGSLAASEPANEPPAGHVNRMPNLEEAMSENHPDLGGPTNEAAAAGAMLRVDLTAARDALFQATAKASKHPTCDQLIALADDPVADFTWLVDNISMPYRVGERAAACLIAHHPADAAEQLSRWVIEPESRNVGLLIIDKIGELPTEQGHALARRAVLEGPEVKLVREKLKANPDPAFQKIAKAKK